MEFSSMLILSFDAYDNNGKLLQSQKVESKVVEMDLSVYPDEIYLLRIKSDEGMETFKAIKSSKK